MGVLIIIFVAAIAVLFSGVYGHGRWARHIGIIGLLVALYLSFLPEITFFIPYQTMFEFSTEAASFSKIAILSTILIFLLGDFAFINHRSHQSELYTLMLLSLCGAVVLFGFKNLVILFLGIEMLSIPLYVMAGSKKTNERSIEAALKYFLMGAFATGFLLFGIALVYGSSGSLDLVNIYHYSLSSGANPMLVLGVIFILIALAFKVSLVPFHMWSPDVYQGSPSLITAFMATTVKIAAFYALFRILTTGFSGVMVHWKEIMAGLIILTLLLANLMALVQKDVKRMLAYSSISHAGYLGLVFFGFHATSSHILGFYLLAYTLSSIGVFLCLIWVEKVKNNTAFDAFRGLGKSAPVLALATTVSMFSMAGIPFTAGFIGKLNLFSQALKEAPILVIVAVLGSILSIAYYLKLIITMFFHPQDEVSTDPQPSFMYQFLAILITLSTLVLGIFPEVCTGLV